MKIPRSFLQAFALFLLTGLVLPPFATHAQEAAKSGADDPFARESIVRMMRQADDWQIAHPCMKPDNRNWERGTWYTGVMAAYKATGDEKYLDQAMSWGRQQAWQVGTEKAGANRLFCVETWAELAILKKDQSLLTPTITWLDTKAPNSPADAKAWYLGPLCYADSLYGASALAMLSQATGDPKYLEILHPFFWDVTGEIFDKDENLVYRDKRFIDQKTQDGKKILWSRANGWVFAGIPRILDYLPANDPQRPRYVALFRQMAAALIRSQGNDGLWRPNLADPNQIPVPETSGTAFFCYGMAWGIHNGILDRATYLPVVKKAWTGLAANLSPEGMVQWGQGVGDRPASLKQSDTHEYVTGAFLLACSEMLKLAEAGLLTEGNPATTSQQTPAAPTVNTASTTVHP